MSCSDDEPATSSKPVQQSDQSDLPALFWDRLDEDNASADAEALRALREESTPEELALSAKDMGNSHLAMGQKLKKRFYIKEAIRQYNLALAEPFEDPVLRAVLHSNRAQAESLIGNWGNALRDATTALRFDPTNVKAYFRGARAANKVEKYEQALQLVHDGLQHQPDAPELLEQRTRAVEGQKLLAARLHAEEQRALALRAPSRKLAQAMMQRGWRVGRPQFSIDGRKPRLDDADGCVHWPMLFMYPQSMTNDVVEDVAEHDPLSAHLDTMFAPDAPPLEWDDTRAYTRNNLDLFYLSHGATPLTEDQLTEALYGGWPADVRDEGPNAYGDKAARWRRLHEGISLQALLDKEDYIVPGIPVVFVVARGTPYYDRFIEQVEG